MCTYNGARYLQQQLHSFAFQTYPPCELIVCDDGSTDNTVELIERFSQEANFPVRILKNERNLGPTKNFEKAIGICEGDLIALSDQDDEWCSDKLAQFHCLFETFPDALAAFGDAYLINECSSSVRGSLWNRVYFSPSYKTPHIDTEIISDLLRLDNVATGATMVFRSRFRDEFVPIPESWMHDGWIAWLAALQGGLAVLPKPEIRYRIHSRQQAGLNPPSIAGRLVHSRRNGLIGYLSLIKQYQDLGQYLQQREQDSPMARYTQRLDAKIRHIQGRAALAGFSFLGRIHWVLPLWGGYQRYARGLVSMLKDIFFVSRRTPPHSE